MEKDACTIVTGAGRGIGRAIALRMGEEGPVILVGRTRKGLEDVARAMVDSGLVAIVEGDVRNPETAEEAIRVADKRGWHVRNLVANAGVAKGGSLETFDLNLFREIMDTNVFGAVHFLRACLPRMREDRKGVIVLMSSVSGLVGSSHNAPYVVSKHGLVGLVKALAHEYGKDGIVTVAVCPGFVESDMTERTIKAYQERHKVTYEAARERIACVNPQRRIIPAEEVARAVAFVCRNEVPSLSGSSLVLSGGA